MRKEKGKPDKKTGNLHHLVPPDWYWRGVKENIFQRFWHKKRLAEVGKAIEPIEGGVILDVGCADGYFTSFILERSKAKKVVGIDIRKSAIEFAQKKFKKNHRLRFLEGNIYHLPFLDNSFDAVFCLEVLEHLEKTNEVLYQIKRVLKSGGYLITLIPTGSLLFKLVWAIWTRWRGKVWLGTHVQSFNNDLLIKLLKSSGFKVEINRCFLFGMLQLLKLRIEKE